MLIGYISHFNEQYNIDQEKKALEEKHCVLYSDTQTSRPELKKLLKELQPGDTLMVYRLSHLTHSSTHLQQIVQDLTAKNCSIISLIEEINTATPAGLIAFKHYVHRIEKGCWMDNVFIERVWRSLKYECVYLNEFETAQQARQSIEHYFDFYNTIRPHATFNGQTPDFIYNQGQQEQSVKNTQQLVA